MRNEMINALNNSTIYQLFVQEFLWSICIGLVLFGLGLGATLVSAFIQALQTPLR